MTEIYLKGKKIHTNANPPSIKSKIPDFKLVDKELKDHSLQDFKGKWKIIATVPSLDTGTCATMTKHLNDLAKKHPDIFVITVSTDLPFAQKRFCEQENIQNVLTLSMMRDKEFGKAYGILIQDGPLAGILARSLMVVDENDQVQHVEVVSEITHEPDYKKAMAALKKNV